MKRKRLILLLVLLWNAYHSVSQPRVVVDERFELTSIAFRLTEEDAFTHDEPRNYVEDIKKYFEPHKNHELIQFIKTTMYSKPALEINYITDLAGDLEFTSKGFVFTKKWLTTYDLGEYHEKPSRWTQSELTEYLRLLNKFYKDTRFHDFFVDHADFYEKAEQNMQKFANRIDTAWFTSFFGIPFSMETVWLVPSNGKHNYAMIRKDIFGKQYHFCAIGCSRTDKEGVPAFSDQEFSALVHEICHNFINPICDRHIADFQEICDTIYAYVGDKLSRYYYGGPTTLLYESLNRAVEMSYYKAHHIDVSRKVSADELFGFIWLGDLVRFMESFENNRNAYLFFDDFIPQIKGFMQNVADQMSSHYFPILQLQIPHVIATFPTNGSTVDTNITAVEIIFSQPMSTSFTWRQSVDEINVLPLPRNYENKPYWKNEYVYVVPIKTPLQPHSKYGFKVPYEVSCAAPHHCSCIEYILEFNTK